jgi:plastocyanin
MRAILVPALVVTLGLYACGGGDSPSDAPGGSGATTGGGSGAGAGEAGDAEHDGGGSAPVTSQGPWDPSKGIANVTGTVRFTGDAPKRRKVDMGSDPACQALHTEPVRTEAALVSDDGGLANVFVWVRKGLGGWDFPVPTEAVVVSQDGCRYEPHVVGVRVGQPFEVHNGDPMPHNVHAFANKNKNFNQTQAPGSDAIAITFTKSEVLMPLKCDLHGWMSTYVGVVENPFFAVSAEDGSFDLGKLPPGEYEIRARHEVYGQQKTTLTIAEGDGDKTIEFTFEEK